MHAHLERGKLHLVSIHTRPWGRVQPPGMGQLYTRGQRFNPHPPLGAGATRNTSFQPLGVGLFQSTPALGGGCNATGDGYYDQYRIVSIHTRPWGRVQPPAALSV